jgi:hypothetical protein
MLWIHLAQDRDQWKTCEHGNKLWGSRKHWEILEWLSDWRLVKEN